jgi:hypothetical protein
MKQLKTKQVIIIILLTSLVNLMVMLLIYDINRDKLEQKYKNKYDSMFEQDKKIFKRTILKQIEHELNEEFVFKSDYDNLKQNFIHKHNYELLYDLYSKLNNQYNKNTDLLLEYSDTIQQIKTYSNKLKTCQYYECDELRYKLFKFIDGLVL